MMSALKMPGVGQPVIVYVSRFGSARMLSVSLYAHQPQYRSGVGGRSPTIREVLVPSVKLSNLTGFFGFALSQKLIANAPLRALLPGAPPSGHSSLPVTPM